MSISREISDSFKANDIIIKLIYINTGLFLVMRLMDLFALSGAHPVGWAVLIFGMPIGVDVIYKPWTIVTNIFAHYDFIHYIFNMLCLYWFGRLFMYTFASERRALKAYVYGGLVGCATAFLSTLLGLSGGVLLGASGGVMSLLVATAVAEPNRPVWVTFFGEVRMKYIAIAYVVLAVIMLLGFSNIGGNLAHIGGAVMGYALAKAWEGKRERDSSIGSIFRRRPKMKIVSGTGNPDWDYNQRKNDNTREVDRILDKIKERGYNSLTDKEKKTLFDVSSKS